MNNLLNNNTVVSQTCKQIKELQSYLEYNTVQKQKMQ